jgi:membrane-associated PAP2 superfamily phosphatase
MIKSGRIHARRRIAVTLLVLVICVVVFQVLPLDVWVQDQLYDMRSGHWLLSGSEPISRLLLYDGLKDCLLLFWAGVGACLLLQRRVARLRPYRRGLRIVFVTLLLVPATVAVLKAGTNIACPRDLIRYGGDVEHVGILPMYSPGHTPSSRQMCFPASHAGSGFGLLSLLFLFRSRTNRKRALYVGLLVGGAAGAYKIAIGDHFLSHTVISLELAWLIANVVALFEAHLSRAPTVVSASDEPATGDAAAQPAAAQR